MPPKKKLKSALNKVLYETEIRKIEQQKQQKREELKSKQKQNVILKSHGIKKKSGNKNDPLLKRPKHLKITVDEYDRVLLIGEGNFSFARSLVNQYYLLGAEKLVATCFDSQEVLYEKYGEEVKENIETIEAMGGTVLYDIDATKLEKYKAITQHHYTKIIFNFPHVGKGIKDEQRNVQSNQQLLLNFFKSATPLLAIKEENPKKRDGEIIVTLKTIKPYDQWKVKFVAKWTGELTIKSSIPFVPTDYPGYCHRRTIGFKEGLSKSENEEILKSDPKIYIFVRNYVMEKEIEKSKKGKKLASSKNHQQKKRKRNNKNDSDSDSGDDDARIKQMKDNQI
ncbi:hypothetical protein BJ944DRAFT_196448 [Cunninghamella echinulata]|nr:hypothetical protein BJ944DRAFT_196448 [Cunninghamella echinulata]